MERRNRQSGFTLIELMIVVAIIGILASVAMPQFRNYAARAKVTEAIMQLTNCRTSVQEVYSSGGALPGLDEWGCGEGTVVSKFVERLSVNPVGIITVTIGNQVGDLRLFQMDVTLAPLNSAGQVMSDLDQGSAVRRWRCGNPADGTNVELVNFMPATCRGT